MNLENLPTSPLSSLATMPPATATELIMPFSRAEKSPLPAVIAALPTVKRLFLSTLVSATEAPTPAAVPMPTLPATLVSVLSFLVCNLIFFKPVEISSALFATSTLALSVPLTMLTMAVMPAFPPLPAPAATLKWLVSFTASAAISPLAFTDTPSPKFTKASRSAL